METGRGKRSKKWQLSLGLKDTLFAGIGIVGLMMISFALGALAGRGDIYRAAYSWGIMRPETKPVAQIIPTMPLAQATPAPAAAPAAAPAPAVAAAEPQHPAPHQKTVAAAKAGHTTPIAGSIAHLPLPAATASPSKRSRAAQARLEQRAREEQLLKERLELAKKLTFLNSLESQKSKKDKEKAKTNAAKPQPPTQVKVATYRNSKTAKTKMAELKKQGVKVTLKQGKDGKGVFYTLYRQVPAAHPKSTPKLAERKEKTCPPNRR